jgi:glycosyltransferase involved in cell wall biosynthesis
MLRGHRIAVVMPAYNEARHIAQCIDDVPRFVDLVVVVDDASRDDTAACALAKNEPRLRVVRHERNQGVGGAILTGYRVARASGMDVAVVMAGDGQMHPDDMPGLLLPVLGGEADYVKGNRRGWPNAREVFPRSRWWGIRALEVLTRWSTGLHELEDFQCGYTALRLAFLDKMDIASIYPRYGFPNDFIIHLTLLGGRVVERIVRPIYGGERSDLKIHRVIIPLLAILARGAARRISRATRVETSLVPLGQHDTAGPDAGQQRAGKR